MIDPQESKLPELEENSSFGFGGRMLPATLNRGNANGELYVDSNNTPLRAGMTRLPRLRLLDKYFKVETVPVYVNRKDRTNPVRSFIVHRWKHDGMIGSERCSVDRFIPRRKGQNREAAYHSLVRAPPKKPCGRALDFPVDLNRIGFAWQKQSMSRALQTIIPGAGRQRVLQLSQKTTPTVRYIPGTLGGRPRNFDETGDQDEYKWPVRPRRRPVIGQPDTILDIAQFRPSVRKSLLDWSSRNMIAAVIDHGVCVVNGNVDLSTDDTKFLFHERCTAVKFSNSGDKIAIGRETSTTSVYRMNPNKLFCEFQCAAINHTFSCQPQAYAWSNDDRYLVVGCSNGYLDAVSMTGGYKARVVEASSAEIVAVSFSPNNSYVACCGRELHVRIFTWPDMTAFMEIGYCAPVRAMSWHPWESSVLCVGGGEGDGGLSIWNVQRQMSLAYRSINFDGCVDTLAWNKVTGELMVNWFVRDGDQSYVAMPIYASFDRITDSIVPTLEKHRILYTAWSPDGSHIACQSRESVFMHNFLDKEAKERLQKGKKQQRGKDKSARILSYYNLR